MGIDLEKIRHIVWTQRQELKREAAAGRFMSFVKYVNTNYRANWHHELVAEELELFLSDPERNRLMLFMPPQTGKSELASRCFPAFALGMNPDLKIAACSYAADLARSFNRDVQRIMDHSPYYLDVFPDTRLNSTRVAGDSEGQYLRNTNEFEIVGNRGFYKSVGVGGGLSGRPVDLLIIDDPVKDAAEALSETVRESIWKWYESVADTRLHNDSKVIVIMTRWHQDDLAGKLLKLEPEKWRVVSLPAIKEKKGGHPEDIRQPGEALWPARHSLERMLDKMNKSPWVFASLYQQRPAPIGGGLIQGAWFPRYNPAQVNWANAVIHYYLDSAYTEKQENDPSALLAFAKIQNVLYLVGCWTVRKVFPDLVKWIPKIMRASGASSSSKLIIEPKASGLSIGQYLKRKTTINVIFDEPPDKSKMSRVSSMSPYWEAGRVLVPESGGWIDPFIEELEVFPNGAHDDRVDCLEGATRKALHKATGQTQNLGGATV